MGKNLVREEIQRDIAWTCPAGVTQVRVNTFASLPPAIAAGPGAFAINYANIG